MTLNLIAEIVALSGNFSFALAFVLARKLENKTTAIFQTFFRIIIALIFFGTFFLILNTFQYLELLSWELILGIYGSIVFTAILGDIIFLQAQKNLGSTKTIAITNTSPFFTFLLASIFLNRPFTWNLLFSSIAIGIGVIIINKGRGKVEIREENENQKLKKKRNQVFWVFNSILVSILWAIGTVFTDYAFTEMNLVLGPGIISMVLGNTIRYLFAAITMLILVIIEKEKTSKAYIKDNDKNGWIVLVISAFLVNILGTIAFTESVKILGASILSLLISALPLFTIPLAYFINKEKITKIEFIGILLTIFGVIVIII